MLSYHTDAAVQDCILRAALTDYKAHPAVRVLVGVCVYKAVCLVFIRKIANKKEVNLL